MTEHVDPGRSGMDRMASLSDGVFAVALTVLVLPVTDVRVGDETVVADLLGLLPQLFAFALSFLVIGRFWLAHHDDLRDVAGVNRRLLAVNLVFLFFVVLLPFPTALLGEVGGRVPTLIYAVAIIATALASAALWRAAVRDDLLVGGRARAAARAREYDTGALVLGFLPSLPLSFVSATAAQLSWLLVAPLSAAAHALRRRALRRRAPRRRDADRG